MVCLNELWAVTQHHNMLLSATHREITAHFKRTGSYASTKVRMIHDILNSFPWTSFLNLSQEMRPLETSYATFSSRNHTIRGFQRKPTVLNQTMTNLHAADLEMLKTVNIEQYGAFGYKESLRHWQQCYYGDLTCPICLQAANFPVETNCGHLFCGSCLIEYWKHESWLEAINCPLCRQKVILLYKISCENQQDKLSKQIVYDIRDYNKRFSGQPRPFADYLYDMPLLFNLAIRGVFTLGGLVGIFFLRVVICSFGTIMCLTSPFDVMPEPLCGILGTVDDLVVMFLLLISMINICSQMESGENLANSTTRNILLES